MQEQEAKTAGEKVDRLMHQYRARGLAVVGLQETLEALANGQVEELLISGALDESHPLPEEVASHIRAGDPRFGGRNGKRRTAASVPARSVGDESQTDRRHRNVH